MSETLRQLAREVLELAKSESSRATRWLTIDDVCEQICATKTRLQDLRNEGLFPGHDVENGRRLIWRQSTIDRWKEDVEAGRIDIRTQSKKEKGGRESALHELPKGTSPHASPDRMNTGCSA